MALDAFRDVTARSKSCLCIQEYQLCQRHAAGGQLHAFVELQGDRSSSMPHAGISQELMQHCRERLISAAVPSCMHCVPQLPRSSAGKLQRSCLRELLLHCQRPHSPTEAATAGSGAGHSLQPASKMAPGHGVEWSSVPAEAEMLPAAAATWRQGSSLALEAAVTGQLRPAHKPMSEAGVMRAFQAALGLAARGLEAVTDFWAAGGDSRAAMQVHLTPTTSKSARLDEDVA